MRTNVAEALQTPKALAAITDGRAGDVVRIARQATGLTQAELAAQLHMSKSALGRLERGARTADDKHLLAHIADGLGIPGRALGITGAALDSPPQAPTLSSYGQDSDVNRQQFLKRVVGAAAVLALPKVLSADKPRVGRKDVTACRDVLDRLEAVDQQGTADVVYQLSTEVVNRLRALTRTGSYTAATGRDLRQVLASAYETSGWLAFDSNRNDDARRQWLECLHLADLQQMDSVRVTVLANMSLHASQFGDGMEAVELAQAAARTRQATPRILSLLAAREALGYATAGDAASSEKAFARSARLMDRGEHPADPLWIGFWGAADFATHQSKAAMRLGDLARAEKAARGAASENRSDLPRNQALYRVRLGNVLSRRSALDEAIDAVRPVIGGPVTSGRVQKELRATVARIGAHTRYRPAAEFSQWASTVLGAA